MRIGTVMKAISPRGGMLGNTFFSVISYFSLQCDRFDMDVSIPFLSFFLSILGLFKG